MQPSFSLLVHVVVYSILIFNIHATIYPATTPSTSKRKWIASEIKGATDGNNISSSYVSKRQVPLGLNWIGRPNAIHMDGNGIFYYPVENASVWPIAKNTDRQPVKNTGAPVTIQRRKSIHAPAPTPTKVAFDKTHHEIKRKAVISRAKCDEYAREVWRVLEPLVCSTSHVAIENRKRRQVVNKLIAGGDFATPGVYAHTVALGRRAADGTFIHQCGGSLISHTWVLTAAHCTYGPNGSPTVVRLGVHDLRDQYTGATISIERMIRHPAYKPPAMYSDVALLKLQEAVAFGVFIKPACLYRSYESPLRAWVSGWGESESDERNDKLRHARLDIVDNLSCALHYKTSMSIPNGITPSMICAGDPKNGWLADTCPGDSGGPLQIYSEKSCMFEIVGITSFGEECASRYSPGVYTRISRYVQWIEDTVWRNETL